MWLHRYQLLCGYTPFTARTRARLYHKILRADYEFKPKFWKHVSEDAKDLVRRILVRNPRPFHTIVPAGSLTHTHTHTPRPLYARLWTQSTG